MTEAPQPFELSAVSLEEGWTLIEASAGTGKTYNIAGLYVRLILDRGLKVRQILVMTFTDAATHELRLRLRERLRETLRAMESHKTVDELKQSGEKEFICAMVAAHDANRETAMLRLRVALAEFDSAPVQTIHSICQRLLREHALACGEAPDMEITPDTSEFMRQLACDFWRCEAVMPDPLVTCALMVGLRQFGIGKRDKPNPEGLMKLFKTCRSHPDIKVLGPVTGDPVALHTALKRAFGNFTAAWKKDEVAVRALLENSGSYSAHQKKYNKSIGGIQRLMAGDFSLDSFAGIGELIPTKVGDPSRMKKKYLPPEHPFFKECDEVWTAVLAVAGDFVARFLRDASGRLSERMVRQRLRGYDDLIVRLDAALHSPGGAELARNLREQLPVALVDEFQDTDPLQCRILEMIYRDGGTLFLIGDPKQSIYRFRGADIFSYLAMAGKVKARYTLDVNYRSEPSLIQAVNTLFSRASNPFLDERIQFNSVKPMDWSAKVGVADGARPLMRVWLLESTHDGKEDKVKDDRVTIDLANRQLPAAVAGEIVRLLESDTLIGNRRLRPSDFAVLVKTNAQAVLVRDALHCRKVQAVSRARESVFESKEAKELVQLLVALAHAGDIRDLRVALSTELFGVTAGKISLMSEQEIGGWTLAIRKWNETFRKWGFLAMFRELIRENAVVERLVTFDDGERRLTNLIHLSRLLHKTAVERGGGLADLATWLASQVVDDSSDVPEHELQLESDADAVRVVTVHRSKGLEYPIVFLPYLWDRRDTHASGFIFHLPVGTNGEAQQAVDLGSQKLDEHRELAKQENLSEDVRNVYVGLTRAKHICYFVYGRIGKQNRDEVPGIAHLLHGSSKSFSSSEEKSWGKRLDGDQMKADIADYAAAAKNCVEVTDSVPEAGNVCWHPDSIEENIVEPRLFRGKIRDDWSNKSYSSLSKGAPRVAVETVVDRDEVDDGEAEGTTIHGIKGGTSTGDCYHAIMQNWWVSTSEKSRRHLISQKLNSEGLDAAIWGDVVFKNVCDVVATPLSFVAEDFKLSELRSDQMSTELRFTFSQIKMEASALGGILRKLCGEVKMADAIVSAGFRSGRGVVTGSIDLVFEHGGKYFVLDWKTNWLGCDETHYDSERVNAEMMNYHLQHVLYSLALHRYLRQTLTGYSAAKHFGGVIYLFVRGMSPAFPKRGVFTSRPSQELLEALSEEVG